MIFLFTIWAVLAILILSTHVVLHLLIGDIERTQKYAPVSRWRRFSLQEIKEIKGTHRVLFPGSVKLELFEALERTCKFAGILVAVGMLIVIIETISKPR